jgi:glucose-6-phosphate 1-dehydrogenase
MHPSREDLLTRLLAEPCTLVIFGATGDLTHRKLIPALYNLAVAGELPPGLQIIGFARRQKSAEEFRAGLAEVNRELSRSGHDERLWNPFIAGVHYHQAEFTDAAGFRSLANQLTAIDTARGSMGNRLFYLASAPEFFDDILTQLKNTGLNQAAAGCWARVIVEKPFGSDLASARHLNQVVKATFHERDTYRIDHYLGKETAQNLMVLRFANAIFEPLWNRKHVCHVQITCAENLGMEGGRGAYYDRAGALRDMVQNHLLQLLSLVAMEPPTDLTADGVRDEKVKVLRSLRPWDTPEKVAANVVRAQYTAGHLAGVPVPAYREEDRIDPASVTEAYVAVRLLVDTWRWSGVPFYIRMGKRLPRKSTEISIHFKDAPCVLFNAPCGGVPGGNVLVIRIQPDEGFSLRLVSKIPGNNLRLEPVKMDFHYASGFGTASPEAYERLLLDALAGDATLFARRDEVEEAWRFIDHIERAWHHADPPPPMAHFVAGTWGPKEADDLLRQDGNAWHRA